jgi:probable HAF family extracellular repeat protein
MKCSLPCPQNPGLFSSAFPLFTALLSPILALLAAVPQSEANPPRAPLPTYNVTDLWLGAGGAINNLGEVAGTNYIVTTPISGGRAVLYKGGERVYLDTLLGLPVGGIPANYSTSTSINLASQVVGWFFDNSSGGTTSFLYDNGRIKTFKVPGNLVKLPGNLDTQAWSINNFGQATGTFAFVVSRLPGFPFPVTVNHAFLRQPNGAFTDVDVFGSSAVAVSGINDWSQIAGYFSDANNFVHAFLTQPGGTAPKDLGINSEAFAVNDLGEVAGNSWPASSPPVTPHAFLYSGGKMHDLGTLGGPNSSGFGINNFGQVVGYSETQTNSQGFRQGWHGFVYLQGRMRDLNDLLSPAAQSWTIVEAYTVNDRGQIVADAINAQAEDHAVILTPVY